MFRTRRPFSRSSGPPLFLPLIGLLAAVATAGAPAEDPDLEDRVKRLEDRLDKSEARNRDLEERLADRDRANLGKEIEDYLERAEVAATRTEKGAWITFYGFLRLDLYYNTARMNSALKPLYVMAENNNRNDNEFALSVRLTRLGFRFRFGDVSSLKASGVLEADFANLTTGILGLFRIRLGYLQLAAENWWIRFGQDWDVVSPLFPSINDETIMLWAGNTAFRRPMIRWFLKTAVGISVDVAAGLSGAVSKTDLDGGGSIDGFGSGLPHLQLRVAWPGKPGLPIAVGIWGYLARLESDNPIGGKTRFHPWMVGIDWVVNIVNQVQLRGEAWYGQVLSDVGGNIGQNVNTVTGEAIRGPGGWIELLYRTRDGKWVGYFGGTIDDPRNRELETSSRSLNWSVYAGVRLFWTENFLSSFGVQYWETQYNNNTLGNTVRFYLFTAYLF